MKSSILFFLLVMAFCTLNPADLFGKTLGVRTLAVGDQNNDQSQIYFKTENNYEPLAFPVRKPGPLLNVPVEERLPLYEKVVTEEVSDSYRILEEIDLPATAHTILLLAVVSNGKVSYLAINDKFSEASKDKWLMVNTTSKDVSFQIGTDNEPFRIDAQSDRICKIKKPAGSSATALGLAERDGEEKTFYSTYWSIREGERCLVIFFEQRDRIKVVKMSDALPRQ